MIECPFCGHNEADLYYRAASKDPFIWCRYCDLMVCSMRTISDKALLKLWENRPNSGAIPPRN